LVSIVGSDNGARLECLRLSLNCTRIKSIGRLQTPEPAEMCRVDRRSLYRTMLFPWRPNGLACMTRCAGGPCMAREPAWGASVEPPSRLCWCRATTTTTTTTTTPRARRSLASTTQQQQQPHSTCSTTSACRFPRMRLRRRPLPTPWRPSTRRKRQACPTRMPRKAFRIPMPKRPSPLLHPSDTRKNRPRPSSRRKHLVSTCFALHLDL
jgi:hypothetical protein